MCIFLPTTVKNNTDYTYTVVTTVIVRLEHGHATIYYL